MIIQISTTTRPESIYYKYHREIFLGAEFVICVSNDLNKKVKTMTDNKAKTITYYSGVDTRKFRPSSDIRVDYRKRLGYNDKDFVILFVGRLTKPKGVYDLLEACKLLLGSYHSIKLLLVGTLLENTI